MSCQNSAEITYCSNRILNDSPEPDFGWWGEFCDFLTRITLFDRKNEVTGAPVFSIGVFDFLDLHFHFLLKKNGENYNNFSHLDALASKL